MTVKREPKGSPTGGQFAPTRREEVSLQGVETLEQVRSRLCPPLAEEYQDGGVRGAYYDANMTVDELKDKLRSAYKEAQEVGLIKSDIKITLETYRGKLYVNVVHPNAGIYEDKMWESGDIVGGFSDEYKNMEWTCHQIARAYALTYYDRDGEWVMKNRASIEFTHPTEQKRQMEEYLLARPGERYLPRTENELRKVLDWNFTAAQREGILPSNLKIETKVVSGTVHVVVSGVCSEETMKTCEVIRDVYESNGENRAELSFRQK